jgi:hypothetical protein
LFSKRTARLRSSLFITLAAALVMGGCARLIASYDVAPNGLPRLDDHLRRHFAFGHADSALLQILKPKKKAQLPKDELLRVLYEGVAAHYAGDYARSTTAFDRADQLADDRVTKSLTKAALSVVVNDMSLAYQPSRTERLLIPYYGALSYLRAGNYPEAAVEARRLSHLLQTLADDGKAPDPQLHAFLRNFAGIVFEASGDRDNADVAYRNAAALDSFRYAVPARKATDGEVVVLIEQGFAPYRVQESLIVTLGDEEVHEFDDDDDDRRRVSAARVAARVLEYASTASPRSGPPRQRILSVPPAEAKASSNQPPHQHRSEACDTSSSGNDCRDDDDDEDHTYVLRMSWPVMYEHYTMMPNFQIFVDSTAVPVSIRTDIASSVHQDFRREQSAIVARSIARAVTKYAVTKSVEKKAGKQDESLGKLAGTLMNIGGAVTEQADTRSWHLVPRSISVVRHALPPGTHAIRVDGGTGARADLGAITVAAGQTVVLSTRVWN